MSNFFKQLSEKKIEINWNKNPIRMDLFLSFLTVPVERSHKHLGSDTGWTRLTGPDNLQIRGGIVGGVEYLDDIQYKRRLDNDYNDYVNPFFIFDILTPDGQQFFVNYYKEDINKVLQEAVVKEQRALAIAAIATQQRIDTVEFWKGYGVTVNS